MKNIEEKDFNKGFENLFKQVGEVDTTDYIIELDNIQKTYLLGIEGVPALKTSMLNIIGTIDKPTKGHLTICGERVTSNTKDETLANIRLARMGFVFQTFNLLSTMSALENVEMPMILQGNVSINKKRKSKKIIGKGGEQQRVTIARAISNHPEILLLDEPTGDLDTKNTLNVMDLLIKLNREDGITMVMVTHDPNLKNAKGALTKHEGGAGVSNVKSRFTSKLEGTISTEEPTITTTNPSFL